MKTLLRPGTGLALALLLSSFLAGCGREDAATPEEMQAKLQALDQEIPALRAKLGEAVAKDRRMQGMPQDGVRVGVPTTLARTLIQRVVAGFVDSVTLRLSNIGVHTGGKIKKVVTIGEYDLNVKIKEVTGRLKTGKPEVTFGGNTVSLALPVQVASGSGTANIDFVWDGKNVSGAVCGDMKINENVGGSVKPSQYPVSGALLLTTTTQQILASPKFPVIKVKLVVEPDAASWAVVQGILDSKGGVCGFVIDKVDIKGVLEGLLGKGFDVTPAHRGHQADGGPGGHRPDHDRARRDREDRGEGWTPRHHRGHDLARRRRGAGGGSEMTKRLGAEFLGTAWLVFGGCGSAVLAAAFPELGIGFVGVSLAFGLTVLTMAYAVGHISGGHFNPAVTVGLWAGGRFPAREIAPYAVAQVLGGVAGAFVLSLIANGKAGFDLVQSGFAANGYAEHSPGGYSLGAGFVAEVVLTFFFLLVILGATDRRAPAGFAPIAIGLALTLIHLVGIPVTNTSVNPARSTAPALFVGGWALAQLWLFWVAPILGAAAAGAVNRWLSAHDGK